MQWDFFLLQFPYRGAYVPTLVNDTFGAFEKKSCTKSSSGYSIAENCILCFVPGMLTSIWVLQWDTQISGNGTRVVETIFIFLPLEASTLMVLVLVVSFCSIIFGCQHLLSIQISLCVIRESNTINWILVGVIRTKGLPSMARIYAKGGDMVEHNTGKCHPSFQFVGVNLVTQFSLQHFVEDQQHKLWYGGHAITGILVDLLWHIVWGVYLIFCCFLRWVIPSFGLLFCLGKSYCDSAIQAEFYSNFGINGTLPTALVSRVVKFSSLPTAWFCFFYSLLLTNMGTLVALLWIIAWISIRIIRHFCFTTKFFGEFCVVFWRIFATSITSPESNSAIKFSVSLIFGFEIFSKTAIHFNMDSEWSPSLLCHGIPTVGVTSLGGLSLPSSVSSYFQSHLRQIMVIANDFWQTAWYVFMVKIYVIVFSPSTAISQYMEKSELLPCFFSIGAS